VYSAKCGENNIYLTTPKETKPLEKLPSSAIFQIELLLVINYG
jgi:hypothetical protein